MTLIELGSLGEAFSGLAVVISLLYVAYELRSNTRTVRAASAGESQDSMAAINELLAGAAGLADLVALAVHRGTLDGLTREEAFRVRAILRANMQRFESMYFRYEAGLLEERVWAVRRDWMAGFLKTPLVAEWWHAERDSSIYTGDFIMDVESVAGISLDSSTQRSV